MIWLLLIAVTAGLIAWRRGLFKSAPPQEPFLNNIVAHGKLLAQMEYELITPIWDQNAPQIETILRPHQAILERKCRQLVRRDAYGTVDRSRWDQEVNYVYSTLVAPVIAPWASRLGSYGGLPLDLTRTLSDQLAGYERVAAGDLSDRSGDSMSGADFEAFCAGILSKSGWTTRLTKGSGDQGVDIVAERGGMRLVVQCKRYAGPVGNGAVQEIIAGRAFEKADMAAVVTTSSFTTAAQALAASADVRLVHVSDLERL
jgi:restriction system protein